MRAPNTAQQLRFLLGVPVGTWTRGKWRSHTKKGPGRVHQQGKKEVRYV